jgi:hypothetical protein
MLSKVLRSRDCATGGFGHEWTPVRNPLDFMDFTDYLTILTWRDNWHDRSGEIFKDKEIFRVKLGGGSPTPSTMSAIG